MGPVPGRVPLAIAAIIGFAVLAPSAGAATTVGQSPPSGGTPLACSFTAPGAINDFTQIGSVTGPAYTVPPGGGVITSWRTAITSGLAAMSLRLFTGNVAAVQATAEARLESIVPGGQTVFPTRISAAGGEFLGYSYSSPAGAGGCVNEGAAPGDLIGGSVSKPVGEGEAVIATGAGQLLNISASLEPDADKDGFGDETQDAEITKGPKQKTSSPNATFRFTGSASVECRLDKKKFKVCSSPKKFKKLDSGRHTFRVHALTLTSEVSPDDKFVWRIEG
ncbi:MAG: hypothetical protein QOG62_2088 [Thermoleophilaceae bacterium]|nr:hypothetical protein [Thermoleophilaceae bacterium]